mgnify:CR=1 FL=1
MELLDKLNWRYATKAMTGQKIPQEKIDNIKKEIQESQSILMDTSTKKFQHIQKLSYYYCRSTPTLMEY